MPYMQWKPEYNIGVKEIDNQHQKMVLFLNQLYDAKLLGDSSTRIHLLKIFEELLKYTEYHFAAEEKLMENNHYPELDSHRLIHRQLAQKVQNHYEAFLACQTGVEEKLFAFLKSWLINHIGQSDQKIADYLSNH